MAFKVTDWAHKDMEIPTMATPEAGLQYLQIISADYNEDNFVYSVEVKSLNGEGARFTLKYWTSYADQSGNITVQTRSRQTLVTLGAALAGYEIGIPNPMDIIGGVVKANVHLSPSKKNPENKYPTVYSFEPVPESIALGFANIDQYYVEDVEEIASEEAEE